MLDIDLAAVVLRPLLSETRADPDLAADQRRTPFASADVVTGANNPRVPASKAEQIVKAMRADGGSAWLLLAEDEGQAMGRRKTATSRI